MFTQPLAPVGNSLALSAIVAALPLVVILVLLGGLRVRAYWAGAAGLATALVVATAIYGMPIGQALSGALEGGVFGLFPIMWIVVNALWIYRLTVRSGHFDVLRRSFDSVSADPRVQALLIAFCFGALLEALAGFGAPVAITTVMLSALGFSSVRAAVLALVANTAPVAFGAMGAPVVTLAQVTGLSLADVSAVVGRQTPIIAAFVPLLLVGIVDGGRGLREAWLPALNCGIVFAVVQFLASNYSSPLLADIVAALAGAAAVVLTPGARRTPSHGVREQILHEAPSVPNQGADARGEVLKAYLPYGVIILVFALGQVPVVTHLLSAATIRFSWPGLDVVTAQGKAVSAASFALPLLNTGGTLVLIAGTVTALVLGARGAAGEWWRTIVELRTAILTVVLVLAIAYVLNLSGQASTIGVCIAGAGAGLAFLAPVLGWFGVAVTGSDTSANALFGALQVTAAHSAGLPEHLLAAANSSGGVMGKMISPQNLTIACVAAKLPGQEGALLRKVLPYSLGLLILMCLVVYAQSTFLAAMVP